MEWFDEVHLPGGHGFGPFPLEYTEMQAYSISRRRNLRSWEMAVLRELSEAYCEVYEQKAREKASMPQGYKSVKMTDTAGIKALFLKQGQKKR